MFARIFRHEWRALVADASLPVLIVAFAVAIGYGTWNGARWVGFQQQAIGDAFDEEQARFDRYEADIRVLNAGGKASSTADPRLPDTAGRRLATRYAVLAPAPLAPLAVGQSDILPYYFRISTDAREAALATTEIENPQRLLSGRFDLAFVIVYLYPLLILALTYNLVSGEKEQGTLALALSQPVPLRTLVLGKVALRLTVFLTTIVGLAAVALAVAGVDLVASAALPRLLLWIAAVSAYGVFWFAVAVAVTALGRSSSTNAAILASIWLLITVVLPSTLNLAASTLYPVPSRVAMVQAIRVASDEANTRRSELLAKYYEDHPDLAPESIEAAMTQASLVRVATNVEIEQRIRPVLDTFEGQQRRQQSVVSLFRYLSPALLMQEMLNDISGTGIARHRTFLSQVAEYHEAWRAFFTPRIFRNERLDSFAGLPRFTFTDESTGTLVSRVSVSLAALLIAATLIGVMGVKALGRYPIA